MRGRFAMVRRNGGRASIRRRTRRGLLGQDRKGGHDGARPSSTNGKMGTAERVLISNCVFLQEKGVESDSFSGRPQVTFIPCGLFDIFVSP